MDEETNNTTNGTNGNSKTNGANGNGNEKSLRDLYQIIRDSSAANSQYRELVNECSTEIENDKFDKTYFVRIFIELGIFYSAAVFEKRNNGTTSFFVADSDSYGKYVLESAVYQEKKEQSLKELVKGHFDSNGSTVCVEFDEQPGKPIKYTELQKFFEKNNRALKEKITE